MLLEREAIHALGPPTEVANRYINRRLDIRHRDGVSLFAPPAREFPGGPQAGARVGVRATIRNQFGPGRYAATCALPRSRDARAAHH